MAEDQRDKCTCYYVSEHIGADADRYVAEHLEKVRIDSVHWVTEYRCPLYGKRWLQDEPRPSRHGGGPYRLRTMDLVCRDLRAALGTVASILGEDIDAQGAVALLGERLGDCASWGRSPEP